MVISMHTPSDLTLDLSRQIQKSMSKSFYLTMEKDEKETSIEKHPILVLIVTIWPGNPRRRSVEKEK